MSPYPKKCLVAALMGNGHLGLLEQTVPPLKPGAVLVEVRASLISPGTELGGWHQLRRQLETPVPDFKPQPFGYANAGVVLAVGDDVEEFKTGDRVACMGGGYAMHADYCVVPHNLCVALPENVTYAQGAYGHLAATALQSLRRAEPVFGEYVAVIGLGLVGLMAARLHTLAGNYTIGWDTLAFRKHLALKLGVTAAVCPGREDAVTATLAFTRGQGLDGAVFAFGGDGDDVLKSILPCMKLSPDGHRMGRIVVVGGTRFRLDSAPSNLDIRMSGRTGPGYHDDAWEFGADYPKVFMRWTTRTNVELCLRLISEGRLDVNLLTTHTIPFRSVDDGIQAVIRDPDKVLGVVLDMTSA